MCADGQPADGTHVASSMMMMQARNRFEHGDRRI